MRKTILLIIMSLLVICGTVFAEEETESCITVTFLPGEADWNLIDPICLEKDPEIGGAYLLSYPTGPSRDGAYVSSWQVQNQSGEPTPFDDTAVITEDITLVPVWTNAETKALTFNTGTCYELILSDDPDQDDTIAAMDACPFADAPQYATPLRLPVSGEDEFYNRSLPVVESDEPNYEFALEWVDADGNEYFSGGFQVSGDETLYPVFSGIGEADDDTDWIYFDYSLLGSADGTAEFNVLTDEDVVDFPEDRPVAEGETVLAEPDPEPWSYWYDFDGWYVACDPDDVDAVYIQRFDDGEAVDDPERSTVEDDDIESAVGYKPYDFSTPLVNGEDLYLYAIWIEEEPYYVIYVPDLVIINGTDQVDSGRLDTSMINNFPDNVEIEPDMESVTKPSPNPSYFGNDYRFVGWYEIVDENAVLFENYADEDVELTIGYAPYQFGSEIPDDEDVILFAVWAENDEEDDDLRKFFRFDDFWDNIRDSELPATGFPTENN